MADASMSSGLELNNQGNRDIGEDLMVSNSTAETAIDDQSPIEEVALTVPTTDDPTLPVMTFRMWVLGLTSCALLAFLNQFFSYRKSPLSISSVSAQIAVLPIGRFMAATLKVVGTVVSATVYFGTSWWLLDTVENICQPAGSPWTCPYDKVFYNASIIWGVVGPQRMFGNLGLYEKQNWFFLAGALAPVPAWLLTKKFPKVKWIRYINMPVLIGATAGMPPASAVNYISWGIVGFVFNYIIFRRHKKWWSRHNYILSGALEAGVAFMGILCYFSLQHIKLEWWGGPDDDHCYLASCPTAPGVDQGTGCPIFS